MSVQAISWAIDHSQHKGSSLVVLLMIANHAHSDGTGAFPNLETLARESRITTRQVTAILGILERSRELVIERGKGPRGSNLYSLPMQQHQLPLEKISSGRMQQSSSGNSRPGTSTEPSLTVLEENRQAAPGSTKPSTERRAASPQGPERQLTHQLKTLAKEKTLPRNGWPTDPLRADLFGGLHSGHEGKTGMHAIAKAFCDSQRLTFKEQLRECVSAAVTTVALSRTGKLMVLDTDDVEKRAIGKLKSAGETLHTFELVKDFTARSRLVTQYVARIVIESATELLEPVTAVRMRPTETVSEARAIGL